MAQPLQAAPLLPEVVTAPAWQGYAWIGCVLFCSLLALWYIIYCVKISKPHRKITVFAVSHDKPLDTDLVQLISLRALVIALAAFSFYISAFYACTNTMLIPYTPLSMQIAVGVGAITLLFFSIKSSLKAIHDYFKDEVTPTKPPPPPGTGSGS